MSGRNGLILLPEEKRLSQQEDMPWSGVCGVLAVGAWLGWGFLLASWGHKPPAPNPATGHVIPFENHGLMYVTASDLWLSRGLLAATAIFLIAALIVGFVEKLKDSDA